MLETNKSITMTGEEALNIIKDIESLRISLRNISNYYYPNGKIDNPEVHAAYAYETTRFIDEHCALDVLLRVESTLGNKFDRGLGDDDMDDVERSVGGIFEWRHPGD